MAEKEWPPLNLDPDTVAAVEKAISSIEFCRNPFDKQQVAGPTAEEVNLLQDRIKAAFSALVRCPHPARVARAAALSLPPGNSSPGDPGPPGDPGDPGEPGAPGADGENFGPMEMIPLVYAPDFDDNIPKLLAPATLDAKSATPWFPVKYNTTHVRLVMWIDHAYWESEDTMSFDLLKNGAVCDSGIIAVRSILDDNSTLFSAEISRSFSADFSTPSIDRVAVRINPSYGESVTVDIQIFTPSEGVDLEDDWIKPDPGTGHFLGTTVVMCGGGGAGGGGQSDDEEANGGAGGGASGWTSAVYDTDDLGSTEPVIVGVGGTCAAMSTGTDGHATSFGSGPEFVEQEGGGGGAYGGTTPGTPATPGAASVGNVGNGGNGGAGGAAGAPGLNGQIGTGFAAGGGGGGGGLEDTSGTGDLDRSGGRGGDGNGGKTGGNGGGPAIDGDAGQNWSEGDFSRGGGGGGGGGARGNGDATLAGQGASGGNYGAGGGGGGGKGATADPTGTAGLGGPGSKGILIASTVYTTGTPSALTSRDINMSGILYLYNP